jgi:hypothetical protein
VRLLMVMLQGQGQNNRLGGTAASGFLSTLTGSPGTSNAVAGAGAAVGGGAAGVITSGGKKDMVKNVWIPPLSLQRKIVYITPQQSYKQYFSIELTIKDYLRRAFDILADGIRVRVSKIIDEMRDSAPSVTTSTKQFFNTLPPQANLYIILHELCGDITFQAGDGEPRTVPASDIVAEKLGLPNSEQLLNAAETLLVCSSQILDQKIDSSRLGKMPMLFDSARKILQFFGNDPKRLEAAISQLHLANVPPPADISDVEVAYLNLINLEAQLEAHANYKEQRMRMLGWVWSAEDLYQTNGVDLVSGIVQLPGAGLPADAETKPPVSLLNGTSTRTGGLEVAKELMFQLEALLEPKAVANASLINALVAATHDM